MRALLLALAVLLGGSAWAAEDLPKAKKFFEAGVKAYDSGQYEAALRNFQQAHALSHNPALYFNMAACEEKNDHFQAASFMLKQYLVEQPNADDRVQVEARIRVLEHRGDAMKRPPENKPPETVENKPAEPAKPVEAPKPKRVISWALLGVTGALAIGAIGAGAFTAVEHRRLLDSCGQTAAGCSDDQMDAMHYAGIATDVLIGVAAAAAVVTVVMFVVEPKLSAKKTDKVARHFGPSGLRF